MVLLIMMTSSNGNIFRVTGPLCGEFTGPGEFPTQRPVTRSFDVFFDLRLNKRLSKHSWGWWFETLSWSLWRHHNASTVLGHSTLPFEAHLLELCYFPLTLNLRQFSRAHRHNPDVFCFLWPKTSCPTKWFFGTHVKLNLPIAIYFVSFNMQQIYAFDDTLVFPNTSYDNTGVR